jgi:hypothetical protein
MSLGTTYTYELSEYYLLKKGSATYKRRYNYLVRKKTFVESSNIRWPSLSEEDRTENVILYRTSAGVTSAYTFGHTSLAGLDTTTG